VDNGIICGYRMQELFKLEPSEMHSRRHDIEHAVGQLHSAGICHGDITPSNIMKDQRGRITLIDFGFAGRVGSTVPSFIPSWVYTDGVFSVDIDLKAFDTHDIKITRF
jgi:tRNA A-37 threonylcarbamoyl transferase component Bud32